MWDQPHTILCAALVDTLGPVILHTDSEDESGYVYVPDQDWGHKHCQEGLGLGAGSRGLQVELL